MINIYGAGMSGLLAANMLKRQDPIVYEASPALPNNHAALLRFRTDIVERETGIKLKKVWVQKAVLEDVKDGSVTRNPSIQLQNMYAMKVTGELIGRSIMNLEPDWRYIAPDDFIEQLAKDVNIHYDMVIKDKNQLENYPTAISTIPMNKLMEMVDWPQKPEFNYKTITTVTAEIANMPCDLYQTLYVPFLSMGVYRVSITGKTLIIEMLGESFGEVDPSLVHDWLRFFVGNVGSDRLKITQPIMKVQKYGKIAPINNQQRKEFILAMTDLYGIYSLGRFATWRQILMDDVAKDIHLIEQMIDERTGYNRRLSCVKKS